MRIVRTILPFLVVIAAPQLHAQDTPLWHYTTTEKITFYQLTPLGDLLVATKEQVVVVDPKTGDVRWARTDILKPPSGIISNPGPFPTAEFSPIPRTVSGVVRTKDGIAVVDLASGETLWDSTAVPLEKVRGHLAVPQHGLVLVYGETPESKRTLVGVDVGTGEVRWRQDTLFRKSPKIEKVNSIRFLDGQDPLVDSDSTFILWISKDGPMKLDARSGELLWRSTFRKDPPLLSEGYAPMTYRNGVLYTPHKRKMVAFNAEDGSVVWERRRKFRSPVVQMEITHRGMVVRGRKHDEDDPTGPGKDFFVDLVDLANGESLWEHDFRKVKVNTPFVVFDEYVYVTREKKLVALGLDDGTPVEVGEFKLEDGEKPAMVGKVDDHLMISSRENYLLIDRNGTIRYHRHYDAPGLSLLEQAVAVAVLVGIQQLDNACERDPACETSGWVDERTGDTTEYLSGNRIGGLIPEMSTVNALVRRMTASVDAAHFTYIFTEDPDDTNREGFSLVKLDKRDGTEAGRVWIDKRRPEYVLDPITGTVFVKENDREIYALTFPR